MVGHRQRPQPEDRVAYAPGLSSPATRLRRGFDGPSLTRRSVSEGGKPGDPVFAKAPLEFVDWMPRSPLSRDTFAGHDTGWRSDRDSLWWKIVCVLAALSCAAMPAATQDYPTKPITLIVPFRAGGGVDIIGRIVGGEALARAQPADRDRQSPRWGRRDRHAGRRRARSRWLHAGDGHVRLDRDQSQSLRQSRLPAVEGLAPIGMISSTPIVLMAHPSSPGDARRRDRAGQSHPGKLTVGTPPPAPVPHLGAELVKSNDRRRLHHRHLPRHRTAHHRPGRRPRAAALNMIAPAIGQPEDPAAWRRSPCWLRSGRPVARRADCGRGRPAGFRGRSELRHAGPGGHAASHHRAAQRGAAGGDRYGGGSGADRGADARC